MYETVQSGIGRARYGKRLDSLVRPRLGSDTVIAAPKTARGRATRERIVTAASELIHERANINLWGGHAVTFLGCSAYRSRIVSR